MADTRRIKVQIDDETSALLQDTRSADGGKLPLSHFTRNALPIGLTIQMAMGQALKHAGVKTYQTPAVWEDIEADVCAFVLKRIARRQREEKRASRGKARSARP